MSDRGNTALSRTQHKHQQGKGPMTEVAMKSDIIKETEKAICIDYARERQIWLPKSCVEIVNDVVWAKKWIAKENGIGCFNRRSVSV
jgi:hypothetical protein